jgi:peroxiredoxin
MKKLVFAAAFLFAAALVAGHASAGKFNTALNLGEKAPEFKGIVGTDDKQHSLADYKDADAVVLVFTCNQCPVAVACEDRIIELQKSYKGKNVQVVAINVNTDPGDKLDKMKERASAKGFNFPYLYDPSQKVARDFGAKVTPDVVLLNKNREVVYMGLIDDSPLNEAEVKQAHLRDAIDSVLAGKTPEVAETRAKGCGIKWDN